MDILLGCLYCALAFVVALLVGVIAHEAAHVIVALVQGITVRRVEFGAGRELFCIGRVTVRAPIVRKPFTSVFPIDIPGHIETVMRVSTPAWRVLLVTLAGPLVSLGMFAFACWLLATSTPPTITNGLKNGGLFYGFLSTLRGSVYGPESDWALILNILRFGWRKQIGGIVEDPGQTSNIAAGDRGG